MLRGETGQATIEWTALVLVCSLVLGGLAAAVPAVDGRSLGGLVAHRIACAAKGGCDDGAPALRAAYGDRDAALLRRFAPGLVYEPGEAQIPVDWRSCRARRCADAPDDRDLDAHRSHTGERATAFTRVVRRDGSTYLQYWLYYPDSDTKLGPSDRLTKLEPVAALLDRVDMNPFHVDDWEGFQVRLSADGRVASRTTSHGHWQSCKYVTCRGRWAEGATGWTRVSKGSHAGHLPVAGPTPGERDRRALPGRDLRERTTTPDALRMVPLEAIGRDRRRYRRLDPAIKPPWEKDAYRDPESPLS